jgi:hypothetical protein
VCQGSRQHQSLASPKALVHYTLLLLLLGPGQGTWLLLLLVLQLVMMGWLHCLLWGSAAAAAAHQVAASA